MSLRTKLPLLCLVIFSGCSLGIKTTIIKNYQPLDSLQEVRVLDVQQSIPSNAVEVGTVKIYDSGTTLRCDSVTVFNAAKKEARKAGGNVLKIIVHRQPSLLGSNCHQISALILKVNDFNDSAFTGPVVRKPIIKQSIKHDSRFALNAGWSWQTSQTDPSLNSFEKDYINGLKSGIHYGAEYNYFYKEGTAVSIQFNMFHSSNSAYASAQTINGSTVSGLLSDNINILYIAPGFTWRILSPTKINSFLFGFTIGYLHYNDDSQFITPSTVSGSTVGISYDLSYDIGLSKSTALGLGFAWKIGTLSSVDVTQNGITQTMNLDDNQRIGAGHLDFSLGLRFR